jgi:hypothetical protein
MNDLHQTDRKTSKVVTIPFRDDMAYQAVWGLKTATSRNEKYGEVGDIFEVKSKGRIQAFELTGVYKLSVGYVADKLFRDEGMFCRQEFIDVWKQIHPKKGFDPDQIIWTHFFMKMIGEYDDEELDSEMADIIERGC